MVKYRRIESEGDAEVNNYYKLTNAQENIYEVEKSLLTYDNTCNILTVSVKFNQDLDYLRLEKTLNKLIELNDSFRIKLTKQYNNIRQYIDEYEYQKMDWLEFETKQKLNKFIDEYKKQPIDIYKNLFEFKILKCDGETFVLYKVHHIINDAWGLTQVAEQIKEIYPIIDTEEIKSLKKVEYLNSIKKAEEYKTSNRYNNDFAFWQEYIKNLSVERIFNKDISDMDAKRKIFVINNEVRNKIKEFCLKNKVTEYTFFVAVMSIYFQKIFNIQNLNFGTPFLNRSKAELGCIGLFVTNLPLNVQIESTDTFIELCNKINSNNFKIFKHSKFPYIEIQKEFAKINSNSNMYEIGFSYQINTLQNQFDGDYGKTEWYFSDKQNNPITIHISNMDEEEEIFYDYITSIFKDEEIENMHNIVMHIINQVITQENMIVKEINVITETEKRKLLKFNNTGKINLDASTISELLDEVCKKYSKNIAVKCKEEEITYSEFYKKICNVADILRYNGVKRNTPVALVFDKSIEMIIAMFSVIKAGGYYVPILPQENKERKEYILNDCNPICILTKEYAKDFDEKYNVITIDNNEIVAENKKIENINSPEDIIYTIYTSGSTGNPKGTKLMHKNVWGLLQAIDNDEVLKADSKDVSMSLLKYSFDASGIDIYTSILNGGKLLLISKDDELNPNRVVEIMQNEKVTRSFLVPKWLELINNVDNKLNLDLSKLRILGTGGETFKPKAVKDLFEKYDDLKILNLYGPTEATMFATYSIINQDNIENNYTSIGKLIYGGRAFVINSFEDIMPTETKGELILCEENGSINNLALGYLNLDNVTNNKFKTTKNILKDDYMRFYKTGDIVKINKKLELEYIGRTDDMVKINNGYLVSINEVEKRISDIIGEKYQFSIVDITNNTTKALVVFIKGDKTINRQLIKKHINNSLSFFMRIKEVIVVKDFPMNNSGKTDKKKLRSIAQEEIQNRILIPPQTKTEKIIYDIISKQCDLEQFSIEDDFIDDLGLDSLNMTVIYTAINSKKIKMQDLYSYTTVKELAEYIDNPIGNMENLKLDNVKIINNCKKFDMKNVLLTGATGFLGIHILLELMKQDDIKKIYCLVRSKGNISSQERLLNKLKFYSNISEEQINDKIIIIDGDITKQQFGLKEAEYKKLKNNITTVINSAANVKHYGKQQKFYETNVLSVKNILDFCEDKISLAHISTLSIAGFKNEKSENKIFDEDTMYIGQDLNDNQYLISKYEAEKEILESNTNSKIFRLGNIMPRASDGIFQENYSQNAFINAIRLVLKLGIISKRYLNFKVEFSPVDECAESICRLIENDSNRKVYHIVNNNEITIGEILDFIDDKDINVTSEVEFYNNLQKYEEIGSEYIKEYILQNNLNEYTEQKTIETLEEANFKWSVTNKKYVKNLLKIIEENKW